MPGQTGARDDGLAGQAVASMEGRTIARPNPSSDSSPGTTSASFNGGPDNCPAKPAGTAMRHTSGSRLQWRAGQLPGQTAGGGDHETLVQALQWRAGQLPGQTRRRRRLPRRPTHFNGGPDNCPAKRAAAMTAGLAFGVLQWRAGQLPGQTSSSRSAFPPRLSALQWRAGQLPGQTRAAAATAGVALADFNGGPDNCPAKHAAAVSLQLGKVLLQWRAGQLPGQTWTGTRPGPRPGHFNGGPDNCPAKPRPATRSQPPTTTLQWRAGQLPGQTAPTRRHS